MHRINRVVDTEDGLSGQLTSFVQGICDWCGTTAEMEEGPTDGRWMCALQEQFNWCNILLAELPRYRQMMGRLPDPNMHRHFCSRKCRFDYSEHNVGSP